MKVWRNRTQAGLVFVLLLGGTFALGFYTGNNPINQGMIHAAGEMIGLQFNRQERDSMVSGLSEQLLSYNRIRGRVPANQVPPALYFDPVPPGFTFAPKQLPVSFSDYSTAQLPTDPAALAFYSVGELAQLIRSRQLSCEALNKFFIERCKRYSPALHCIITPMYKQALQQARLLDKELAEGKYRGPLHGIPYGLKDLFSVAGTPTTWGSVPYRDQVLDFTSTIVTKLKTAGAVLIAKTSVGELAMDDVWFGGRTRNPWDTTAGSSGSSAGSAAGVAAGLFAFAIGTETWGSIVSPSTVCGVTGLRPTFGRVSRAGAMALSWSMDKVGPICRTAEDCAIVLSKITGSDGIDRCVKDVPFNYSVTTKPEKLKVGYLQADFLGNYSFRENDSAALAALARAGVALKPVSLPTGYQVADLSIILSAEAAAAFDELTRSNRDDEMVLQTKNSWPNIFRTARFIPAAEYINANRIRQQLQLAMNKLMQEFDVLVVPSFAGDALLLTNLTGHPSITVPTGFAMDGTLASITFVGNLYDEGTIITFARFFQGKTRFHLAHPPNFL